jgi:endonuclease YncB( thermonuclease family)
VRLANVAAPQPLPHARCWAEAAAALQASRAARDLVGDAHSVQVTPAGGRDEYGRQLAQVSLDGADLGDALYAQGLAAHRPPGKFDWCAPLSEAGEGAPPTRALMDFSR